MRAGYGNGWVKIGPHSQKKSPTPAKNLDIVARWKSSFHKSYLVSAEARSKIGSWASPIPVHCKPRPYTVDWANQKEHAKNLGSSPYPKRTFFFAWENSSEFLNIYLLFFFSTNAHQKLEGIDSLLGCFLYDLVH